MSLTRLDCGTPQAPVAVNQRFSDTYAYGDMKIQFVFSCYLIKHGDEYLLWDTGHAMTAPNVAPKVSVVDQLAKLDIKPEQIKYVGISHYHADHTGQVGLLSEGDAADRQGDWDAISSPKPAEGVNFKPFESWIKGDSKVEPLADRQGCVRRRQRDHPAYAGAHAGPSQPARQAAADRATVMLSGDAVHFRENYDTDGVPAFNFDRAQTVASIERIKKIAANLKATVIIQHDARDIDKLPAFPASAK